jgi:fused signal recognition particle receptor
MIFFRKSELERRAEKGDKSAILELVRKGKRGKAIKLLEKFSEDPDLRKVLFDLYLQEGMYREAYNLIERYGREVGTAKQRGLVCERVEDLRRAVEEYLRVGDFESLFRAGELLEKLKSKEQALEVFRRCLKLAPALKRSEVEERIRRLSTEERSGLLERIRRGLRKTRETVRIGELFSGRAVDEELFEDLEETLVRADVGVKTVLSLVEEIKKEARRRGIKRAEDLRTVTREKMLGLLSGCEGTLRIGEERPTVMLFLGVNGSGKTTSIGKLAYRLVREGRKVMLVAGDTFRAAAMEQLEVWARRAGADITLGEEGSDPASVVYRGVERALKEGHDVVLVDTAGRLHTKEPLVNELRKIKKVIQKMVPDEPSEVLLVLDATVGQNSLQQAKVFKEALDITGIIVTKLDGSAKGGSIVAICRDLRIPIKFVGVGEGPEDLQPFRAEDYVKALVD